MNKDIRLVNLTGRELTVFLSKDDQVGTVLPSEPHKAEYKGFAARGEVRRINGIPVICAPATPRSAPKLEDIVGLPEPVPGTIYVVPFPVLGPAYALGRKDVIGMGQSRTKDGTQVGAEGFNYPGTAAEYDAILATQA